jgi:hypothetical protein
MEQAIYKHKQMGWPILVLCGAVLLALTWAAFDLLVKAGPPRSGAVGGLVFLVAVAIVLLAVMILFASLTVIVSDDSIEARFGPGVIQKRFSLPEVQSCKVVRNPWLLGWGIRWFPGCWVFNIAGFGAIELLMKNGRRYRIGTDEPQRLNELIQAKLARV